MAAPPARGFWGVLLTLLSNPFYTLSRMFSEQKLLLALQLLVPLALLPLRYARAAFLLLPGLLVVGLADSGTTVTDVYYHYATHFLPYAFLAALVALAVRSRQSRAPTLIAVAFASAISTSHFGAFGVLGAHASSTPFPHVSFDWTAEDAARQAAFRRLAALVPSNASVCAGEHEGAQLGRRDRLLSLKRSTIEEADYVIYSQRSLHWGGGGEIERVLRAGEYGVVDLAGDLALLVKGGETSRNSEALSQMGAQ